MIYHKMMTFLPYASFYWSLKILDNKRILKQVVEAFQIWCCLTNNGSERWSNHPAVKMWKGYEKALQLYMIMALIECESRIKKDGTNYYMPKMRQHIIDYQLELSEEEIDNLEYPFWFGNDQLHFSHQSSLYRKDSEYYEDFKDTVEYYPNYYW